MKTVNSLFTFHNVSINSKDSSHDLIMKYVFTFHNVSINSIQSVVIVLSNLHLHSIMYLLIPESQEEMVWVPNTFTFHNVSINSKSITQKVT